MQRQNTALIPHTDSIGALFPKFKPSINEPQNSVNSSFKRQNLGSNLFDFSLCGHNLLPFLMDLNGLFMQSQFKREGDVNNENLGGINESSAGVHEGNSSVKLDHEGNKANDIDKSLDCGGDDNKDSCDNNRNSGKAIIKTSKDCNDITEHNIINDSKIDVESSIKTCANMNSTEKTQALNGDNLIELKNFYCGLKPKQMDNIVKMLDLSVNNMINYMNFMRSFWGGCGLNGMVNDNKMTSKNSKEEIHRGNTDGNHVGENGDDSKSNNINDGCSENKGKLNDGARCDIEEKSVELKEISDQTKAKTEENHPQNSPKFKVFTNYSAENTQEEASELKAANISFLQRKKNLSSSDSEENLEGASGELKVKIRKEKPERY